MEHLLSPLTVYYLHNDLQLIFVIGILDYSTVQSELVAEIEILIEI